MILSNQNLESAFKGFKVKFQGAFDATESFADKVAMTVSSDTAEEEYAWLGQFPALREWIGERQLQQLRAHGFRIRNRDFESTVTVARNDMQDDKFGLYGPMFSEMGRVTKLHPDTLVFSLLKEGITALGYDGVPFFGYHASFGPGDEPLAVSNKRTVAGEAPYWYLLDLSRAVKPIIFQKRKDYTFESMDQPGQENVFMRKEFIYGVDARVNVGFGLWQLAYASNAPLLFDEFDLARQAMTGLRGDKNHLLGVKPTHILVPPSLEMDARNLLKNTLAGGEANVLAGLVDIIVSPYLA
ncbi:MULTISPECIES: Mu-like prophage major head subunit gpT family protein [Hyphomicrobiales]|jgi:phage major head subunit gpT-like protein|uniref:Mu-like prophage major head subunit gpT family protein n=1 Tax=Methylobacterium sp. CCH7-A2 TaxID=1768789 RepID=UPI0008344ECE|nr:MULTISPECIES: Mu-like prophage major head subunit gpT family protein [Hyphomicrobiales]